MGLTLGDYEDIDRGLADLSKIYPNLAIPREVYKRLYNMEKILPSPLIIPYVIGREAFEESSVYSRSISLPLTLLQTQNNFGYILDWKLMCFDEMFSLRFIQRVRGLSHIQLFHPKKVTTCGIVNLGSVSLDPNPGYMKNRLKKYFLEDVPFKTISSLLT